MHSRLAVWSLEDKGRHAGSAGAARKQDTCPQPSPESSYNKDSGRQGRGQENARKAQPYHLTNQSGRCLELSCFS